MKRVRFAVLGLALACHPSKKSTDATPVAAEVDDKTPAEPVITKSQGPNSRVICQAPKGVTNDPRSIPEAIRLINALPKPVTVACLIDALKGPFKVNATSSFFSAQPAYSEEAPRIFLFFEPLYISVVPAGLGGEVVEFSVKLNIDESVKGELVFPVTGTLAEDAAYEHIKFSGSDSTTCGSCHFAEARAPAPYPANAFVSKLLVPTASYNVTAAEIETSAKRCLTAVMDECPVLEALTSKGALIQASFEE